MYRQRLTQFIVFFFVVGLVAFGCTPTAVDPIEDRVPTIESEEVLTPQQVTENFYNWYLETIGDRSDGNFINPLAEGLYRQSPYLTAEFIARIDDTLAGLDQGGYDPILLAQDIPVGFEVQEPSLDGTDASLVVLRFWGGNPDPSPMIVHLTQIDDRWLIDNVTPFENPDIKPPVGIHYQYDAYRLAIVS